MAKTKWTLYYADGSLYSSADGMWADAPLEGVQVLVVSHPDYGRQLFHGLDYYAEMPDGGIFATDDLAQFLRATRLVKFGHSTTTDNYKALLERAHLEN